MTSFVQFCAGAKMRHDYSDMIQVRYTHPNGEHFDTWISGEEVLHRLKTMSREDLIRSFGRMKWEDARASLMNELKRSRQNAEKQLRDRLADSVEDKLGGHIFGETLADHIRGDDGQEDPRVEEKKGWQQKLRNDAFRAVALDLAWINLEGTFPPEDQPDLDDWI